MHVVTHLSEKYNSLRNAENGWTVSEAGMAQLDDIVGSVMKKLDDLGVTDNTIVVFTTDNGAENFTWPDGGQTPFAGGKGTVLEGGFRVPCIVRWPGHVAAGKVENGVMSGLDWFPTLTAAAGDPNIVEELKKGKRLGDRTFSTHLDGYDQLAFITGKDPSARKEIFYFAEGTFGAVRLGDYKFRFIDQPQGWLGGTSKPDFPIITHLRLDPYERTGLSGSLEYTSWMKYQFWRFVFVQDVVAKFAQSFVDFPPLQKPASFNMDAVKAQIATMSASHAGK
jgi:arylsulfatase